MLDPGPSADLDVPAQAHDDHHIVVELRLSGPIVHETDSARPAPPNAEVAVLRDRIAALEASLAAADARIEALSSVFAAAVEHFANVQASAVREPIPPPAPTPAPAPRPTYATRPKVRGVRRMIAVLRRL